MTNEEAISKLKSDCHQMNLECACRGNGCEECHIKMAIDALEKQKEVNPETKSVSERKILQNCIWLMGELFTDFVEWYRNVHGDNAIEEMDEEDRFRLTMTYSYLVQRLFLWGSNHSGGTSTRKKCRELGIDDVTDTIEFAMEVEE